MRIYVQPSAKTSCASDWVVSFVHIPCICNSVYISASCLAPVKGMAGILAGLLALLGPTIQSAEWEFAQSLPTESYVVIGRVLRVCQKKQNRRMGVFSDSADSEPYCHWASSQTL